MDKPNSILTVAIPTYNRADYLDRCLQSIFDQLVPEMSICVKVFDNCSTDTTEEVVKKFTDSDIRILYTKNEKNIGPDLNIGQCYHTSTSKYTLVFGDDDVFLENSLNKIIKLLTGDKEYGLIFLNYYHFTDDFKAERPKRNIKKTFILNDTDIVAIAGFRIGFISASIVNTKAINKMEIIENMGSNFNHLFPILKSSILGYDNLYVSDYGIAQQIGNFGTHDVFNLFANNFYAVVVQNLGKKDRAVKAIENELMVKIFPSWILKARKSKGVDPSFKINSIHYVTDNFKSRLIYWFLNYPVIKWYLPASAFVVFVSRILSKLYFMFYIKFCLLFKKSIKN